MKIGNLVKLTMNYSGREHFGLIVKVDKWATLIRWCGYAGSYTASGGVDEDINNYAGIGKVEIINESR